MLVLLISFLSFIVMSATCEVTYTMDELLSRSITNSIDLNLKNDEIDMIRGHIRDAEKIYNPEFEHFTTTGNQQGDNNITSETRLWFTFQLGNKRERKGDVFRAQKELTAVEKEFMKVLLKKELFMAFIRNKQILYNYKRLDRINGIIESLISRYRSIKYLTPDQKIEKGSLEISVKNIELQLAELRNELETIERFYQRMVRSECLIYLKVKEVEKFNKWPKNRFMTYQGENSLQVKIAEIALGKSKYELKREESQVWPDLKIGPMWQFNRLGPIEYSLFGVGLVFPIPSFNLNKGLREAAQASINRNERNRNYMVEQRREEFEFRQKRYADILQELKEYEKLNNFNHILDEARDLFKRGLISIPIFLSYKNELFEVINRSQRLETTLAGHLMEMYIINNLPLDDVGHQFLVLR